MTKDVVVEHGESSKAPLVAPVASGVNRAVSIIDASLALLTAGSSAAAAIVYLAHKGNVRANWFAICQQFDSFCERISGSLIGSFAAMVILIALITLSAFALARRH
ncbi:hypothetical protein EJB05_37627, partial [Eragrostis curvula]